MPCDSVTTIQTVFRMEHEDKMLAAAAKLGLPTRLFDMSVVIDTAGGRIQCFDGRTEIYGYVQPETVEALMKGYAEEVFSAWEHNYSQFQEVSRDADSRDYAFVNQ